MSRLRQYFGKDITEEFAEPIILAFDASQLPALKAREDCGKPELYLERGPVSLDHAKIKK